MKNKTILLLFLFISNYSEARLFDLQNEAQKEAENQVIELSDNIVRTCWGWGCTTFFDAALSEENWQQLELVFSPKANNAKEERSQIANAIGVFETITGELNGQTKFDLGAPNSKGIGKTGQTDCVDESTNTTRYLKFLYARGYLKFHGVGEIEIRLNKPLLPFLGQHFTATINEIGSEKRFAVDGWWFNNGHPAVIQKLEYWLNRKSFDPNKIP